MENATQTTERRPTVEEYQKLKRKRDRLASVLSDLLHEMYDGHFAMERGELPSTVNASAEDAQNALSLCRN